MYSIDTWRISARDTHGVTYRPTAWTWVLRFGWSGLAIAAGLFVHYAYGQVQESRTPPELTPQQQAAQRQLEQTLPELERELSEMMGQEEFERWKLERDREREAARQAWTARAATERRIVEAGYWGIMGLLALGVILPPLTCLWNRVRIELDPFGHLVVRSWGLVPRTRKWPLASLGHMVITAQERMHRSRKSGNTYMGWFWYVNFNTPAPSQGLAGGAPQVPEIAGPRFLVYHTRDGATTLGRMPAPVAEFVRTLHALTGIAYGKPIVLPVDAAGRTVMPSPAVGHQPRTGSISRTYNSIDEVPPELRGQFDAMLAEAKATGQSEFAEYTLQDEKGQRRTYRSLGDMPPEVRQRFESLRRQRHGGD